MTTCVWDEKEYTIRDEDQTESIAEYAAVGVVVVAVRNLAVSNTFTKL